MNNCVPRFFSGLFHPFLLITDVHSKLKLTPFTLQFTTHGKKICCVMKIEQVFYQWILLGSFNKLHPTFFFFFLLYWCSTMTQITYKVRFTCSSDGWFGTSSYDPMAIRQHWISMQFCREWNHCSQSSTYHRKKNYKSSQLQWLQYTRSN